MSRSPNRGRARHPTRTGDTGAFHVSKRHLHRYLAEFDFRYNARRMSDAERAASLIRAAEGKRLTFRPIKGR